MVAATAAAKERDRRNEREKLRGRADGDMAGMGIDLNPERMKPGHVSQIGQESRLPLPRPKGMARDPGQTLEARTPLRQWRARLVVNGLRRRIERAPWRWSGQKRGRPSLRLCFRVGG